MAKPSEGEGVAAKCRRSRPELRRTGVIKRINLPLTKLRLNPSMAAAADPAEGFFASRPGRALAFGCSFTACLLAAGALTITLLGRPGGPPPILLELPQDAGGLHKPPAPPRFNSDDGPVARPVPKP